VWEDPVVTSNVYPTSGTAAGTDFQGKAVGIRVSHAEIVLPSAAAARVKGTAATILILMVLPLTASVMVSTSVEPSKLQVGFCAREFSPTARWGSLGPMRLPFYRVAGSLQKILDSYVLKPEIG
jgi:hypothetical protein